MPKHRGKRNQRPAKGREGLSISAVESILAEPRQTGFIDWFRRHLIAICTSALAFLLVLGIFAKNGWLPRTDPFSGQRTGWFGREVPKNSASSWNPFGGGGATPTPTPQLSKEYIYAGSRLLAVEDANASAIPPEDLAIWRPSTGVWWIYQGQTWTTYTWGQSGDIPVQGDYDADGKTDFAIFRPSTNYWWIVQSSDNTYYNVSFGASGDIPVAADFDGDGKTDIAVWRPSTYYWYWLPSSTCTPSNCPMSSYSYGTSSDIPVPADFDGDGRADIAVWRNSNHTFYSVKSSNGQTVSLSIGNNGDTPVCGDFDGDGKVNYAVLHGADWIIENAALTSSSTTTWQSSGGVPVPNDYDGDGICDIAVWKAASGGIGGSTGYYWYIRQSHDLSTRTVQWGTAGDIPVPALYRR